MSLSVKSIASWSLAIPKFSIEGILCRIIFLETRAKLAKGERIKKTKGRKRIVCSICSFQEVCGNDNDLPLRSSSRSFSGLIYDRELFMSSTVKRIVTMDLKDFGEGLSDGSEVVYRW